MGLLDDVGARMRRDDASAAHALEAICVEWLSDREERRYFDWRYYFVRYPGARSSVGEGYFHNQGYDKVRGGFSYGRLRMLHGGSYNAYFSDALLRAAWFEGHLSSIAHQPHWWHRDDPGMRMKNSTVEIRCLNRSFEVVLPQDDEATVVKALDAIKTLRGAREHRVHVRQKDHDGVPIDREDRIQVCIRLARALHAAGL